MFKINVCLIVACDVGTYGLNCTEKCSGHCRNGTFCNFISGHCGFGCDPGYTGYDCEIGMS